MKKEWIKPEMKNLEVEGTNTTCEVKEVEVETLDLEQARKTYHCQTHNLYFNSLEALNTHMEEYNNITHCIKPMS